jgi:hypothetical protein
MRSAILLQSLQFPAEAKRLKLERPRTSVQTGWLRPGRSVPSTIGQIVFDRAGLNRHKKLAAALLGYVHALYPAPTDIDCTTASGNRRRPRFGVTLDVVMLVHREDAHKLLRALALRRRSSLCTNDSGSPEEKSFLIYPLECLARFVLANDEAFKELYERTVEKVSICQDATRARQLGEGWCRRLTPRRDQGDYGLDSANNTLVSRMGHIPPSFVCYADAATLWDRATRRAQPLLCHNYQLPTPAPLNGASRCFGARSFKGLYRRSHKRSLIEMLGEV